MNSYRHSCVRAKDADKRNQPERQSAIFYSTTIYTHHPFTVKTFGRLENSAELVELPVIIVAIKSDGIFVAFLPMTFHLKVIFVLTDFHVVVCFFSHSNYYSRVLCIESDSRCGGRCTIQLSHFHADFHVEM